MFNFFSEIKKDLIVDNALLGNFNIINLSNKALYVEGHLGIVVATPQYVSFKVKKNLVIVNGDNLEIRKITSSTLLIEGQVKSVESQ